jgi:hypothetical protein
MILTSGSFANDRPFQYARTAIEEDDEEVWSFESWAQRLGSVRSFSIEPEYAFSTRASVQMELTRLLDHHDVETGHEAEVEFKYVFNNIARDGWGLGIGVALSGERLAGSTTRAIRLELPLSLPLREGKGLLHVNLGLDKASDARLAWTSSVGIEGEVARRTTLFAELARDGDLKYGQVGVRYWVKKERLALDFTLQQKRSERQRASGFLVAFGRYDL